MNKVLDYFKSLSKDVFTKDITVYGYESNYPYHLISSILPYLFSNLEIKENLALKSNSNRDGRIKEKKYLVIHDTGDTTRERNAAYWSHVVKTQMHSDMQYHASFQYVVGNDGIYHNIPDNEIAYHAGDGTQFDYKLYYTGIKKQRDCKVTIKKGYYYINHQNTNVLVPSTSRPLFQSDINDDGILVVIKDDEYYLGETYFNQTYQKIANRGGNNNGIGIEICVNQGDDIYLNYQLASKLVAKLLDEYHLPLDSIKPHHFFSGKNCPQTLRENHLWPHFIKLVKTEYDVLQFEKEGYQIQLVPLSDNILKNGRITSNPQKRQYKIITKKDESEEEYEYIF